MSNLAVTIATLARLDFGVTMSTSEVDMNKNVRRASLDSFGDAGVTGAEVSCAALPRLFGRVICCVDKDDRFVWEELVRGFDSRLRRWRSKSSW